MPYELVFPTVAHLAAAWAVLALAEAVYILFGFGAGLIAVGTLALVLPDPRDVIVLLLLVGLPAELWVVATSRRQIRWRGVSWICLGVLVGVPLGTWVLTAGDAVVVLTLLGAVLVRSSRVNATVFLLVCIKLAYEVVYEFCLRRDGGEKVERLALLSVR